MTNSDFNTKITCGGSQTSLVGRCAEVKHIIMLQSSDNNATPSFISRDVAWKHKVVWKKFGPGSTCAAEPSEVMW